MGDKVAIITGGSRGIGAAITKKLAKDGFNVVFNYNTAKDAAEAVVKECESYGVKAVTMQANVRNPEDCKALADKANDEFGRVDTLVNNAGIDGTPGPLWELEEDMVREVIDVDIVGPLLMSKYALQYMVPAGRGGSIVSIASMIAQYGSPGMSPYGAAKAGVVGMTRSLAKDVAPLNINVNAIGPGAIETDMMQALPQEVKDGVLQTIKENRFGRPEEIAEAVSYFASENGRYATGQFLIVDGSTNL